MSWLEDIKSLEPSDIVGFPQWAMGATRPQPEFKGWGPQGWQEQANWQKEQMDANPMGFMGATNIIGKPGGNRVIQSLSDKTGELLAELGYRDFPGVGAIIQNFRSKTPAATSEMYGAFKNEMGPLMDKVKVSGNIRPEAWNSVQGALDRGVYNEYPNLANQWQRALQESQGRYPNATASQQSWRWQGGE